MSSIPTARILYNLWARHLDPTAPPFERLAPSVQEAWFLVASGAKLLGPLSDPKPDIVPGLLYISSWDENESWQGGAPRRPAITFELPGDKTPHLFVIDARPKEVPLIIHADVRPKSMVQIPGILYDKVLS